MLVGMGGTWWLQCPGCAHVPLSAWKVFLLFRKLPWQELSLNTHAHSSKPLVITRCGGWHFKLNCILPTPGKSCLKP